MKCVLVVFLAAAVLHGADGITQKQVEADWLLQDRLGRTSGRDSGNGVTVEEDATGGRDGIIDGQWGFHTENEDQPWWQVDLGGKVRLGRIVLYNRTELAERNSRIKVLVSDDGVSFRQVYQHDGKVFYGFADKKPLDIRLGDIDARYVRLQLPGRSYFHLDEVEIYEDGSDENIALGREATQSSISQWSKKHSITLSGYPIEVVVSRGLKLADDLCEKGVHAEDDAKVLRDVQRRVSNGANGMTDAEKRGLYLQVRWAVRRMALSNPLLDFERILFVKRAPGTLPHMSDQYYGWWSRPGGGIYLLDGFQEDSAKSRCLTEGWAEGNFLRPDLSYDGTKDSLPEDAFYSVYEMDIASGRYRRLTRGRYDDFDARYLPNGRIVFLSTRKGQFLQCGKASAMETTLRTMPDSYVRCGGDNTRPCAVFTLHSMNADGGDLEAISAFENFEWTPSIADDGRILYARWDYIDRFNGHFMSLWSCNQDGTNGQLVYGNYTTKPQCIFEARQIPGTQKLVFTAAAHHSIMGGSLAILDRTKGYEYEQPLKRLTPDVPFPETEANREMYYANPYPLSEDFYLTAWSCRALPPHAGSTQIADGRNPVNATGIYLLDGYGNLELLYRDGEISSMYPLPVRSRPRPFVQPSQVESDGSEEGCFLVQDVYRGLKGVERGTVQSLRIIGVPPKVQPHMNSPQLGVSAEDPGKFVIGTVPVREDGSAYFRVPSGVSIFFQALDGEGLAVQTMRSLTYVHSGQTLACVGCHESRDAAPATNGVLLAVRQGPSKVVPGPEGSWPLRFDRLVGPVLERLCVDCHRPNGRDAQAGRFDLTGAKAYGNLLSYANDDLKNLVFERDISDVGGCAASQSKLLAMLRKGEGPHKDVHLDKDSLERLVTWMDVYAQLRGSFSEQQEAQLVDFRGKMRGLLAN
jgi:hypothetical protein